MSITRKLLKGMGLTQEQEDTIIEAHTETVDAWKEKAETYKADAEKLKSVQKELDKAKEDLEAGKTDDWKAKYEKVEKEYKEYKDDQEKKANHEAKETAYRELLQNIGISEKRIASVLKVSDVDSVELDSDGKIKDADDLKKSLKTEWADFIVTTDKKGAETSNPPANNGGTGMTKDEIYKIKDPVERQKAIANNLELFGRKDE